MFNQIKFILDFIIWAVDLIKRIKDEAGEGKDKIFSKNPLINYIWLPKVSYTEDLLCRVISS